MTNTHDSQASGPEQTLQRLASQFTVCDIMIPKENLVKAKTEEEALHLLIEHDDFNLIPIETETGITGYVERHSAVVKSLSLDVTVGTGCSILDLVDVLAERQFSFVLGKWGIDGYVHFSDLNHHLVRLPFYILLQAVEAHVISLIEDQLNEDSLHIVFPKDAKSILGSFKKKQLSDANRRLLNEVNLERMFKFARQLGMLKMKDEEITELCKVRHSLAHVPETLIHKHDDVKRLMWATRQCSNILNGFA